MIIWTVEMGRKRREKAEIRKAEIHIKTKAEIRKVES